MEYFDLFSTFLFFLSLLIMSCTKGEKTTRRDKDVNDYWSDG